jgi:hypothetical protein
MCSITGSQAQNNYNYTFFLRLQTMGLLPSFIHHLLNNANSHFTLCHSRNKPLSHSTHFWVERYLYRVRLSTCTKRLIAIEQKKGHSNSRHTLLQSRSLLCPHFKMSLQLSIPSSIGSFFHRVIWQVLVYGMCRVRQPSPDNAMKYLDV